MASRTASVTSVVSLTKYARRGTEREHSPPSASFRALRFLSSIGRRKGSVSRLTRRNMKSRLDSRSGPKAVETPVATADTSTAASSSDCCATSGVSTACRSTMRMAVSRS